MGGINIIITISCLLTGFLFAQNNAFPLDTHLAYIRAANVQWCPTVAFDGTNYFLAWLDWRSSMLYYQGSGTYASIYGCRMSHDGVILDSSGIFISSYVRADGYTPYSPAVAYGNGVFLFVWKDYRDGLVHAARIDTSGIVLDPDGFVICSSSPWQDYPSVAFDGTNFLVVWWDARFPYPDTKVLGSRVSPNGSVLDPDGIIIYNSGECLSVSVAFGIDNYLVVCDAEADISGVRVDTAGNVLDTLAIPMCTGLGYQYYASATFGGNNFFVVWQDWRFDNTDIYGCRVDTSGVVLDTNGFVISALPEWESYPKITFGNNTYLCVWGQYCARIDTAGVVLDTTPIIFPDNTIYCELPVVAYDGINYFITWHNYEINGDVHGTRVETSGVVIDTNSLLLSWSTYPHESSSAAFNDTNYFVVWTDYRDTTSTYIYGTRIDTLGTILDPTDIPIIHGSGGAIAYDGRNYLVAYDGIKGAFIDDLGSIIDTLTIFATGGSQVSILFDSTNYFVAWSHDWYIYGARVDTLGIILNPAGILIGDHGYSDEKNPALAFDGTNYFVVWESGDDLTAYHIYGARVNRSGVLIDTTPISIATESYNQRYPAIDFDGTNYFVVWQDSRNSYADIYGARITKNGVVLNPGGLPICTAPSAQYRPEIKFDGHNYCVIWEDWRNGEYTDIYGCYVTTSGGVTQEFVVSDQPNLQLDPHLVKGPDKFLVTYTGFADSLNHRPANTMRIWAKFQEFVGIEEKSGGFTTHKIPHLFQNYPNPFTRQTEIRFQISQGVQDIELKIYDISGRLVKSFKELSNHQKPVNQVVWDGKDDLGNEVSAGIYFYQLKTGNFSAIKKMLFVR